MSEKIYFLKWCWRKIVVDVKSWDSWQWGWIFTCFLTSMFFSADKGTTIETISRILLACLIVFYWIGYLLIYSGIKRSWNKYQEEKRNLVKILGENQ